MCEAEELGLKEKFCFIGRGDEVMSGAELGLNKICLIVRFLDVFERKSCGFAVLRGFLIHSGL